MPRTRSRVLNDWAVPSGTDKSNGSTDHDAVADHQTRTGSTRIRAKPVTIDGVMPNISRNALLRCAESANPALWAAVVRLSPSAST